MSRREKALLPSDGAGARLALELRSLRDGLGPDRPNVDDLVEMTGVSRPAIYAAFGGRVPTWPTVRAIVSALGGNVDEWWRRWRTAEAEVQVERVRRRRPEQLAAPDRASEFKYGDGPYAPSTRQRFAEYLGECLKRSGLSISQIALRAGIPRSSAYHAISGRSLPNWDVVSRLLEGAAASANEIQEWQLLWVLAAQAQLPGPSLL